GSNPVGRANAIDFRGLLGRWNWWPARLSRSTGSAPGAARSRPGPRGRRKPSPPVTTPVQPVAVDGSAAMVGPPVRDHGVAGNERLTAWAGVVLLVLLAVELVTSVSLRSMMGLHVFIGVALVGPLVIKLGSVRYRF